MSIDAGVAPRSHMALETEQAAACVARQLSFSGQPLTQLRQLLAARPVRQLLFCARGSSDNAAVYGRYVIQATTPLLALTCPPSVGSLYPANADFAGTLFVGISQSGRSPDLVNAMMRARDRGAATLAAINALPAPLADQADVVLPLEAGKERSVAATKSFIASLATMLQLSSACGAGAEVDAALHALPVALEEAYRLDWSVALHPLADCVNLFTLGRGPGFAIAREAALKLKEVCGIHAEAISTAEVRHGPMALIGRGFPVIMFVQDDASRDDNLALAAELVARGACVMVTGARVPGAIVLPDVGGSPFVQPITQIQSFYRLAERVAAMRGFDPDAPPYLSKVTKTL